MKQHIISTNLLLWSGHLAAWILLAAVLNRLTGVSADEIISVNGQEIRTVYSQSLLPYILFSTACTAAMLYLLALWVFPALPEHKKAWIAAVLLPPLFLGLEYAGFAWLNGMQAGTCMKRVFENGRLTYLGSAPEAHLPENPFAFWNLALLLLGLCAAIAWHFARAWQVQKAQLQALKNTTAGNGATGMAVLKSGTEIYRVPLEEILFLKKEGNYFTVFTTSKKVVIRQNMETALQWLPAQDFCRVHRSYIVALRHITVLKPQTLMIGEHEIPVGEGKRAEIRLLLQGNGNITFP